MRKALGFGLLLATVVLTIGSSAAAATTTGATVVTDAGCITNVFATTCTVLRTTTNTTVTPSGNVSYVTNGTVEREIRFAFGGTYTATSEIHSHQLAKQGEVATASEHYEELTDYVSATYSLSCISSYDLHYANGEAQFSRSELECTTL
ncbi:MAG: hypothetical protein ACRDNB_05245 [Gaiellaceae bacterium]